MLERLVTGDQEEVVDVENEEFLANLFYREPDVDISHEYERRFLLNALPPGIEKTERRDMTQVYVPVTFRGTQKEVRLRKTYNDDERLRLRAVEKGKLGLQGLSSDDDVTGEHAPTAEKEEVHLTVDTDEEGAFDRVWNGHKGDEVTRTRFYLTNNTLPSGAVYEIHIDVFRDDFEGLVRAEIEFKNPTDAREFMELPPEKRPKWLGQDVTGDKKYKSKALFKGGGNTNAHEKWKKKSAKVKGLNELLGKLDAFYFYKGRGTQTVH